MGSLFAKWYIYCIVKNHVKLCLIGKDEEEMKRTGGIEPCSPVPGSYTGIYGGRPKRSSISGTDTSGKDLSDFRKLFSENCFAQGKEEEAQDKEDNTDEHFYA